MIKEICDNIYLNEIDLPNSPLKYLNSYIVKTDERNLIIDTGFNRPECVESFFAGVKHLGLDLQRTDVLVTHVHSDHCGLIGELGRQGAEIFMGELESKSIASLNNPQYWSWISALEEMYDLGKYDINIADHPGYRYRPETIGKYKTLNEGDVLNYGKYSLRVLDVPGHTRGHIALYEPNAKLFFCGDLILDKITPTITFWGFEQDILQVYFDTLSKVEKLEVELLLTGHRAILTDHKKRIGELKEHHIKRLKEIEEILREGEQSVCEVASKMHWDIKVKSWEEFPKGQKWFATGEAMAHLEHLYCTGVINRREDNKKMLYSQGCR